MRTYNFGAGRPDPSTFPSADLAQAAARILSSYGHELVHYPDGKGYRGLRDIAAMRFERSEGRPLPVEEIALTTGSMQALQLITQALVRPGDPVVTEAFTYSGSLSVFRMGQARLVGAPIDEHGFVMDELEGILKRLADEDAPPRFIYTIASHQNPTGSILPADRRKRLLELAEAFDVLVVDDHCYGDILFDPALAAPTLYTLDTAQRVVYVASFSKILGPGVRLGYFAAPESLMNRILRNKLDGGTNALASMIVAEYFREHLWTHIAEICRVMKARKEAMVAALAASFADLGEEVAWTDPPGGLFVWVRVPDATDIDRVMALASERGVICAPGRHFSAAGEEAPYLRLAYGFPSIADIQEGVPILAECVRAAQPSIADFGVRSAE
jgi:2-aminoadipate transaminase